MQCIGKFLGRAATLMQIIVCGHLLNWPWRPSALRRRVRGEVTRRAVCRYLRRYAPVIAAVKPTTELPPELPPESTPEPTMQQNDNPRPLTDCAADEHIFTIWLQGEEQAPSIVKACLRSMRRHFAQTVTVLDEHTLFDWIDLPQYVVDKWRQGKIRPAHFADICRVELLHRYGGVWIDATAFVTAPLPQHILDSEFFIYMSGECIHGAYAFVQNCFFRARRGSVLLHVWREAILEYWRHENSAVDYFVHQLLFLMAVENNPSAAEAFERVPHEIQNNTHQLWFAYGNAPYDRELFESLVAGSFFQKTEYKSLAAKNPEAGSFADVMIKM